MQQSIMYVVNNPAFFVSHRLQLAQAAYKAGFEVHVATSAGDACQQITNEGFIHHTLPISRQGKNPFSELRTLYAMYALFKKIKPNLVHLVTIKPVLYGGIAARLANVPAVVAAISGLGAVYTTQGFRASLLRAVVAPLYRFALRKKNISVIFQNIDDRNTILALTKTLNINQCPIIRGSGVEIKHFPYSPEPPGTPIIVLAARLLKDKGIIEFIEAAKILKARNVDAKFWLIGQPDPGNPHSVTEHEVDQWHTEKVVTLWGFQSNIAYFFSNAHIVVLPSYREGLPKVLQEAAACGRAVITTDVPGCRDAIEPGISGLLVPARNINKLADAMEQLINNPALRNQLGLAGRNLCEKSFKIEKIVDQHLSIYNDITATMLPRDKTYKAARLRRLRQTQAR